MKIAGQFPLPSASLSHDKSLLISNVHMFRKWPGVWIFCPSSGFRPEGRPWIWSDWGRKLSQRFGHIAEWRDSFCFSPGLDPKGKRDGIRAQLRGPLACLSLVDTRLALHRGRLFTRTMSKIGRSLCLLFGEIYFLLSPLPWAFSVKARPLTSMKHTSGMDLWFSINNTVRASGGKRWHVVIVGPRVWPGLPQTSLPVCS